MISGLPVVVVCGSRTLNFGAKLALWDWLTQALVDRWRQGQFILAEGNALGADQAANRIATYRKYHRLTLEALWKTYGHSAGKIRNGQLLAVADEVIAMWDMISGGTKDMITRARAAGLKVTVVDCSDRDNPKVVNYP